MANSNAVTKQPKPKRPVPPQLTPFKKGKGADIDPRINTNGRPKSFDQLRALFQDIASDEIVIQGKAYTRAQAIGLAMSMDKKHMREFLEYAYGKVPQPVTGIGKDGAINLNINNANEVYERVMEKIQGRVAEGKPTKAKADTG